MQNTMYEVLNLECFYAFRIKALYTERSAVFLIVLRRADLTYSLRAACRLPKYQISDCICICNSDENVRVKEYRPFHSPMKQCTLTDA